MSRFHALEAVELLDAAHELCRQFEGNSSVGAARVFGEATKLTEVANGRLYAPQLSEEARSCLTSTVQLCEGLCRAASLVSWLDMSQAGTLADLVDAAEQRRAFREVKLATDLQTRIAGDLAWQLLRPQSRPFFSSHVADELPATAAPERVRALLSAEIAGTQPKLWARVAIYIVMDATFEARRISDGFPGALAEVERTAVSLGAALHALPQDVNHVQGLWLFDASLDEGNTSLQARALQHFSVTSTFDSELRTDAAVRLLLALNALAAVRVLDGTNPGGRDPQSALWALSLAECGRCVEAAAVDTRVVFAHLWGLNRCGDLLSIGLSFADGHYNLEQFLSGKRLSEPRAVDLRVALLLARQQPLGALALHREAGRRGLGQENAKAREALIEAALGFLPAPALVALQSRGLEAAAAVLGAELEPSPFEAAEDDGMMRSAPSLAAAPPAVSRLSPAANVGGAAQKPSLRSAPKLTAAAAPSNTSSRLRSRAAPAQVTNPSPGRLFADIPGRASRRRPASNLAPQEQQQPQTRRAPAAPPPADLFQGITGRITRARARELR